MQPNSYMKRKFYRRHEDGMNYKDTSHPSITLIVMDADNNVLIYKTAPERCLWGEVAFQGLDKPFTVYALSTGTGAERFSLRTYFKDCEASVKEIPGANMAEVMQYVVL